MALEFLVHQIYKKKSMGVGLGAGQKGEGEKMRR
jgi:hypothetical protein